jgi:hypothetical protein
VRGDVLQVWQGCDATLYRQVGNRAGQTVGVQA